MIDVNLSCWISAGEFQRLDIGYPEHFVMAVTVVMAMTFSKFGTCATEFD